MNEDTGDTTEERLFGGGLLLRQPRRGHRAGTDAVLLAAAAAPAPGALVIDVGSGIGTVGLALARREPTIRVRLLERESVLAALARQNCALNGLADRVAVEQGDLFDRGLASIGRAALVVSNPPFYQPGTIRPSPVALKARAYQGETDHAAWLHGMIRLAAPKARVMVIHTPAALPALLAAATNRIGSLRLRPVMAHADEAAVRIVFGGTVGDRGPLAILPPLVLHEADGRFTPLAEALHRGEAVLPLFEPPRHDKAGHEGRL